MKGIHLQTHCLRIDPLAASNAPRFAAIAGDPRAAPMLGSFTSPFPEEEAAHRIARNTDGSAPGHRLAVRLDGEQIGTVGLSPPDEVGVPSVIYFLDPDHWGRGLTGEAMATFIPDCLRRHRPPAFVATAFEDNPASQRLLLRLGFDEVERGTSTSRARSGAVPSIFYRLDARRAGA